MAALMAVMMVFSAGPAFAQDEEIAHDGGIEEGPVVCEIGPTGAPVCKPAERNPGDKNTGDFDLYE